MQDKSPEKKDKKLFDKGSDPSVKGELKGETLHDAGEERDASESIINSLSGDKEKEEQQTPSNAKPSPSETLQSKEPTSSAVEALKSSGFHDAIDALDSSELLIDSLLGDVDPTPREMPFEKMPGSAAGETTQEPGFDEAWDLLEIPKNPPAMMPAPAAANTDGTSEFFNTDDVLESRNNSRSSDPEASAEDVLDSSGFSDAIDALDASESMIDALLGNKERELQEKFSNQMSDPLADDGFQGEGLFDAIDALDASESMIDALLGSKEREAQESGSGLMPESLAFEESKADELDEAIDNQNLSFDNIDTDDVKNLKVEKPSLVPEITTAADLEGESLYEAIDALDAAESMINNLLGDKAAEQHEKLSRPGAEYTSIGEQTGEDLYDTIDALDTAESMINNLLGDKENVQHDGPNTREPAPPMFKSVLKDRERKAQEQFSADGAKDSVTPLKSTGDGIAGIGDRTGREQISEKVPDQPNDKEGDNELPEGIQALEPLEEIDIDASDVNVDIVLFAAQHPSTPILSTRPITFCTFTDYDDFTQAQLTAKGFLIDHPDMEKASEILNKLRASPESAVAPIYLLKSLGEPADSLSDGLISTMDEGFEKIKEIDRLVSELDDDVFSIKASNVFSFLGYLYARPQIQVLPYRHWSNERFYRFPLIEAMIDPQEDPDQWIEKLIDRGLLQNSVLIDRLHLCSKCHGAHLNFVDVCPSCGTIDITQKPFLHCFLCGDVAPEEKFLSQGVLSCPNCSARLRHIGTDYDRPLENHMCNNCEHEFIEPEVIAVCQHCGAKNNPEELTPRNIHTLELTERGRLSARNGTLDDVFALLDSLNNVSPAFFEFEVDWLLGLTRRYTEDAFSLIGVQMQNVIELTEKIGKHRMAELIDGFVGRVKEIIRTTDITTRTSRHNIWLLLPKTNKPGCEVVRGRIDAIRDLTKQEEGVQLEFSTVIYTAPDDANPGETAKLLLARLMGELAE